MKPILFNTDMVRAILDGRKTVTRRVVRLKYSNTHLEMFTNKYGTRLIEKQNEEPGVTTVNNPDGTTTHTLLAYIEKEPPYRPNEILYVRETWALQQGIYWHKAGLAIEEDGRDAHGTLVPQKWRPSIHMPREAARIFLRVTDVRVERLQDITENGAFAEGAQTTATLQSTRHVFRDIWNSTIKPADRALYGWEANPWAWVIEIERISREEVEEGSQRAD